MASDHLSDLPDCLLIHILSLLPTEDAVRTCVLSKRWPSLWTYVHNFHFIRKTQTNTRKATFVEFALARSISSKIKKFVLQNYYDYQIKECLNIVVEKKVEDVVLSLHRNRFCRCQLPESFRTCSSLITLVLRRCFFDCAGIAWKSLKSIKLEDMVLSDHEIANLLSGCPALETMELVNVEGFRRLEINSITLKRLNFIRYGSLNFIRYRSPPCGTEHSFEICAPYLQNLEISGNFCDRKCRLVDVSSLVNAKRTFNIIPIKDFKSRCNEFDYGKDTCGNYREDFIKLVLDYLQKLSFATKLTIGTWFTECMLQFKGVSFPELKCKHLALELQTGKFNLCGVAGLLRASPHVETLSIYMEITLPKKPRWSFELPDLIEGGNIYFQSLKNVKIVSSSWMCLRDHLNWRYAKKFLELSEFLLKNASALEKFIIISKGRRCKTCSMNCVYLLAEKLLGCPRSSTNSVIIFQDLAFHESTASNLPPVLKKLHAQS